MVDPASLEAAIEGLTARDSRAGEDARAAVEWLTAGDEEVGEPVVFTRRRLQLFLWYELPRKWLIEPDEHAAVGRALGSFFDELGGPGGSRFAFRPQVLRTLRRLAILLPGQCAGRRLRVGG